MRRHRRARLLADTEMDAVTAAGVAVAVEAYARPRVPTPLTIGAATDLGRNVLLNISAEVGLTDDAPDYAARAAGPVRFDLPVF
jgi:hypothetical protein